MASSQRRVLAVVPARQGSRRLPKKNILPLNGRPLISHTLLAAKDSGVVDHLVVSSNDKEVLRIAEEQGVHALVRPEELATDDASSEVVVEHALKTLKSKGLEFDVLVLLQPTSPLRQGLHLREALSLFQDGVKSVLSVTEQHLHPSRFFQIGPSGDIEPFLGLEQLARPVSSLAKAYRPNGAIYIAGVESFLSERRFFLQPSKPYVMNQEDSWDIDTLADFEACERILSRRNERKSV